MMTSKVEGQKQMRREVLALLVEATPTANGWGYWILAAPMILFLGWLWVDLFIVFSPIPSEPLDMLFGMLAYILFILLPFGYGAHRFVTSFPRVFQQVGWDIQPMEPVRPAEQYMIKYIYTECQRAATDRRRVWLRVAQGWVYLEIAAIFIGFVAMVPLFFSAVEFGVG